MNFQPQPYPLFVAYRKSGTVCTGRVIGWSVPNTHDAGNLDPIMIADGGAPTPSYPDGRYWLADTREEAVRAAKTSQ